MLVAKIEKNDMAPAVKSALKIMNKNKPTFAEGLGILICAKNGEASFTTTNLTERITVKTKAEILEEGEVLLDAKTFSEIVKKLPNGTVFIQEQPRNKVAIKIDQTSFNLSGMNPDNFPGGQIKNGEEKSFNLTRDQGLMLTVLSGFAADENSSAEPLKGVHFGVRSGKFEAVAVDGYRLALRRFDCENLPEDMNLLVPATALSELGSVCKDDLKITYDNSSIHFITPKTDYSTLLKGGDYISYDRLIRDNSTKRIELKTKALRDACARMSLIAKEGKNNLVAMSLEDGGLRIASKDPENEAQELVPWISFDGEMDEFFRIGFNTRFIEDALKAIQTDEVRVGMRNPIDMMFLQEADNEDFIMTVLPVRMSD